MTDLSRNTAIQEAPVKTAPKGKVIPLMGEHWLETATGQRVDFIAPSPKAIHIEDIAWGLSRQPRFAGHTCDLDPYVVSVHSVWVSCYVWGKTHSPLAGMYGLLHDAHEAYTGDIPRPLKMLPTLREEIRLVEERLQSAIYKALNLSQPTSAVGVLIAEADQQALAMEARIHTRKCGVGWSLPEETALAREVGPALTKKPPAAFEQFMNAFNTFNDQIKALN